MGERIVIVRVIVGICVATLLAAEIGAAESTSDSKPAESSTPRSLTAIRTDVSQALRTEAITRRAGDNVPQVLRLVDLYLEMASHPKRDTSPLLNDLGIQVRLRLQSVRERIESQIKDKGPSKKASSKLARVAQKDVPHVLAQPAPQAGAGGGQQAAAGQGAAIAPNARVNMTDFGPELVELIEATVSPSTWKINGGNGAVVYYAPLRVLVVSAPDDVHVQIGDVLKQLKAAQREYEGAQAVVNAGMNRAGD